MKHSLNKADSINIAASFKKITFLLAGFLLTALGIVGAFLPVMPTTVFLIGAVFCFSRSSKSFESWLLNHPRFGATLRNWKMHGAISRPAKVAAFIGMLIGYVLFYIGAQPSISLALIVAVIITSCAVYVVSRPGPPQS